jgi:hypothetical protein
MAKPDDAGRVIAGLLTYNPGPGIYSRLERAVQAMPENVRTQELPGLLKRYKEGVPGWELKATDLDSVIAGRDVVPREELLARVRYASPVYTHGEAILGGRPQTKSQVLPPLADDATDPEFLVPGPVEARVPDYQFPDTGEVSRLGKGVSHGKPRYESYGQGGADYAELLLTQPHVGGNYGSHWDGDTKNVVAHARYDTHGDALRINELQSDLGIHNRKVREQQANLTKELQPTLGSSIEYTPPDPSLPFPMEDSWADLLIKRLALEAARKGHRAIEVASPRAIADKVGGNIDNYEHFYGKVVPGAIERLGRRMGGLVDDSDQAAVLASRRVRGDGGESGEAFDRMVSLSDLPDVDGTKFSGLRMAAERLLGDLGQVTYREGRRGGAWDGVQDFAAMKHNIANNLAAVVGPQRMNEMYLRANEIAAAHAALRHADNLVTDAPLPPSMNPPGRRYIMSDEMRRRLIEGGVGAAVATGIMSQDDLINRLNQ